MPLVSSALPPVGKHFASECT